MADRKKFIESELGDIKPVSASQVWQLYNANEITADKVFKCDMPIPVTGIVASVGKDILDDPYIIFKTDDFLGMVQCMFWKEDAEELINIYPGQKITLVGKCTGKMLTEVIFRDCVIIKNVSQESHKKPLKKIKHKKHRK